MLAYLHHARNIAEHGLTPVVTEGPFRSITPGNDHPKALKLYRGFKVHADGTVTGEAVLDPATDETVEIKVTSRIIDNTLSLSDVKDRGLVYAVPNNHLGKKLHSPTPSSIAEVMITYLRNIVDHARMLI